MADYESMIFSQGNHLHRHRLPVDCLRLASLFFFAAGLFAAPDVARAAGMLLPGHVPPPVRKLTPVDRLNPSKHLDLVISLPLRNRDALSKLLAQIYDPASTNFHHYLSTEQFIAQFGPAESDYLAVSNFFTSNNFTVTSTYANRTLLDVRASVADIERTFHLNLRVFNHPTEARTFFAPDTEPTLDALLPILHVDGLDNFILPHPAGVTPTALASIKHNGGSGPIPGTFIGSDFRNAYAPGVSLNGAGQTVALFELDGYFPSDITAYKAAAGLPNIPVTNILLDGFPGTAGQGNIEVALDIDMAMCMAPGLNEVMVYEGIQPNDVLNQMAIDNRAKQISCSWSWFGFSDVPPTDQIMLEYSAQGQTFFCASGDSGAYGGTNLIDIPVDDTNVTSVGGTMLTTDQNGAWQSEVVWSRLPGQSAASSGGASPTFALPPWQQGIDMTANLGSTNMRNIPDVALTAEDIYLIYNDGSPTPVGGTSCAAPLWAGLTALINQQAIAGGNAPVGFLNPTLYAIGKGPNYSLCFHDITVGNDTNLSSSPDFPATPGYDLCTGWGTPAGSNLINTFAPPVRAPVITPGSTVLAAETCFPTNGAIDPGETVTVNFQLQNVGTGPTTHLVATLLTNSGVLLPSAPQTYGAVPPNGGSLGQPFTFTAGGTCGGTITASFQLQDGASNLGTVSFNLQLGLVAPATTFTQNFDTVGAPVLPIGWITAHSGADAAWVTATTEHDTAPNAAFARESNRSGLSELTSPGIPISLPNAQLTFRQWFNTDNGFDGGVLAIQIGNGAFQDIEAAGGSFVTNGYNGVLGDSSGNPIGGLGAWTGNSGGFITTIVNLPPSAAGQTIHLKWRFGTDDIVSGLGWYVDTISVVDGGYACCSGGSGAADLAVTETASTNPVILGQNLTYTLAITNLGAAPATAVTVTDTLPGSVTFVSASPGFTNLGGGLVVASLGTVVPGAGTNLSITVNPTIGGSITNFVTVATTSVDSNPANNTASLVTTVDGPPIIVAGPTNLAVIAGTTAIFSVTATGSPPPVYQWLLDGVTPVGINSSTLTLNNVQPSQAGAYSVLVTNSAGATNSAPATLTVYVQPAITAQPSNQLVLPGANVTFTVTTTGNPPPVYQWLLNGVTPVGVNSSSLTLNNVQPSQAGAYSVLVTNLAGSTNSAAASLAVLVQPVITSISVTNSGVSVSFQSLTNLNYTLQSVNQLTNTNWSSLNSPVPGNGGLLILHDTNAPAALRFYRILCN